ncbi:MAG: hypothetical protein U1A27_05235 [Phycisphaerae bacterium]
MHTRVIAALLVVACTSGALAGPATSQPRGGAREPKRAPRWVPSYHGPWDESLSAFRLRAGQEPQRVATDVLMHATAPTLCARGKELLAVFEYYSWQRKGDFGRLAQAGSRDGGRSWSAPAVIEIAGLEARWGLPRDPALVSLGEKRLRLYFTLFANAGLPVIASAISDDGRTFTLEREWRLAARGSGLRDPVVMRVGNEWQLFAVPVDRPGKLAHARSLDGVNFERLNDLARPSEWAAAVPRFATLIPSATGMVWLESPDGAAWSVGKQAVLDARDAAVLEVNSEERLILATPKSAPYAEVRGSRARATRRRGGAAGGADAAGASAQAARATPGAAPEGSSTAAPGANGGADSANPSTAGEKAENEAAPSAAGDTGGAPAAPAAGEEARNAAQTGAAPGAEARGSERGPNGAGESARGGDSTGAGGDRDSTGNDAEAAGSLESDESDWPPAPDFANPVNYVEWLRRDGQSRADDDAAPYYAELLLKTDAEGHFESALPPLDNPFSDPEYKGPPGPWRPEEHPNWEQSYQTALPLMEKYRAATSHADYSTELRFAPDDTEQMMIGIILPDLSAHRQMAKEVLGAAWRAPDGQVDSAAMIDSWKTVLDSSAHLQQGITLIESLVGTASANLAYSNARQALAAGVIPADQLETALTTLQQHAPTLPEPGRWVRGEMAFTQDFVQYATTLSPGGEPRFEQAKVEKVLSMGMDKPADPKDVAAVVSSDPARAATAFQEYFRNVATAMGRGYPATTADSLAKMHQDFVTANPGLAPIAASLDRAYVLQLRGEAERRATQLAYATHLFHARNGRWPASIDELPAGQVGDARRDPFSGRDFAFQATADGPRIYSVGMNGRDDGGVEPPTPLPAQGEKAREQDDWVYWPVKR